MNYDRVNEHTLQTNAVAFEALHGLVEERLARGGHSRDVVLFPFDGGIDMLEDLFDRVCDLRADTIARDECHLTKRVKTAARQRNREDVQCTLRHTWL